jgi:tetratricopeptide (TPR) repeat protein
MTARLAVAAALVVAAQGWHPLESRNGKVEKGNDKFEAGSFEEALELYDAAALQLPDEPGVHLDRGAALFKKGTASGTVDAAVLDRAAEAFSNAVSLAGEDQTDLKADAFYNMGNTRFAQERWEEAAAAYRQALKLRPGFEDAAYNLALALEKIEQEQEREEQEQEQEQEREEQEQEQEREEQEQQQDDEKQCDGGEQQQEQAEQQQEQDQQQSQQQQQRQRQEQQQSQQQSPEPQAEEPVPVTKQEAEAILDALQRGEKNLKLQQLEEMYGQGYGKPEVDKDW